MKCPLEHDVELHVGIKYIVAGEAFSFLMKASLNTTRLILQIGMKMHQD